MYARKLFFRPSLPSLFLAILMFTTTSSIASKGTLGIAPEDSSYFKSPIIKCRDGSNEFPKEHLNDGFCDCPDGTDEPGTSACPEGKFYCLNVGHVPLTLFSSRVNDRICDCCDGSDEYDGKVNCPNTCWEAGKAARDKLKKKIVTYQGGAAIRKNEVEHAKKAITEGEDDLVKLKAKEKILKGLVQKLKDRKLQIEKAEEQEHKAKEKEEQRHKEAEERSQEYKSRFSVDEKVQNDGEKLGESTNTDLHRGDMDAVVFHDATTEDATGHPKEEGVGDTTVVDKIIHDATVEEATKTFKEEERKDTQDTDSLSREDLGRLVASRWTREKPGEQLQEVDVNLEAEGHETNPDDDYNGYSSEADEDNRKYDEDETQDNDDGYDDENEDPVPSHTPEEDTVDHSDIGPSSCLSWLDKIQETMKTIMQAVNLYIVPINKSEAAQVRKEYDESSTKLSDLQSRISSLTKKLTNDYGPEKEFFYFYDQCFENKLDKYVYKVCPFKEATQVEGYSTTRLGRWENFADSYRVMQFMHGDKCWNGPDRSLKVKLRCGLKNELTDVDEPSRCEYVALLSTPAVCSEERLKELQHKLDSLSKDLLQSHDELSLIKDPSFIDLHKSRAGRRVMGTAKYPNRRWRRCFSLEQKTAIGQIIGSSTCGWVCAETGDNIYHIRNLSTGMEMRGISNRS